MYLGKDGTELIHLCSIEIPIEKQFMYWEKTEKINVEALILLNS